MASYNTINVWDLKYRKFAEYLPGYKELPQLEIREIRKFVSKSSSVLDIGCGRGRVVKRLAPLCREIAGIDKNPRQLELARKYLAGLPNIRLYNQDIRSTDFADSSFDVIISTSNTFGNMGAEKEAVLSEIKRLIAPGGVILLSVFRSSILRQRIAAYRKCSLKISEIIKNTVIFEDGYVSEGFSCAQLRELFSRFGFRVRFIPLGSTSYLCVLTRK